MAVFEEHRRNIDSLGRPAASGTPSLRARTAEPHHRDTSYGIGHRYVGANGCESALDHMRQLGILREITGRRRHRSAVRLRRVPAILNEGTEPY